MSECVPYFPPPPTGEHIRAFLADFKGDVRDVMRELYRRGWKRDQTRPMATAEMIAEKPWLAQSLRGKDAVYPWWVSPHTGESVRGLKAAMQRALEGPPPPSPMAQRLLDVLNKHPDLKAEMQILLKP